MLTEDKAHIIQVDTDDSLFFHRIADRETVLAGRIVDDGIALWAPGMRFEAPAEAAASVDLRVPGMDGSYSLDQFRRQLDTSGLAQRILAGERVAAPDTLGLPRPFRAM